MAAQSENWVTLQNAVSATGNGDSLFTSYKDTGIVVEITGSFVSVVTFEADFNGTFRSIEAFNVSTGAVAATASAAGVYVIPVPTDVEFRARNTWTSGTSVTVKAKRTQSPLAYRVVNT